MLGALFVSSHSTCFVLQTSVQVCFVGVLFLFFKKKKKKKKILSFRVQKDCLHSLQCESSLFGSSYRPRQLCLLRLLVDCQS